MKYAVEVDTSAMTYSKFRKKIGSGIQKLMGGYTDKQTHRQYGDHKRLFLLFQNKESKLKIGNQWPEDGNMGIS
jgi:hypothetical protein